MRGLTLSALLLAAVAGCASVPQSESPPPVTNGARPASPSLTGNWAVDNTNTDGAPRKTYFNLIQQGQQIAGTIRGTQFYYRIAEGAGGAEGFTLVGSMMDGRSERKVTYTGRLVGDELHLSTRRRPELPPTEAIARRVPDGEGAMPARSPLPTLHRVADNGLARTPPMGWNSWNKFAGRVDDAAVRAMADAMAINGMRDAGYVYVNIDDTWDGGRDARRLRPCEGAQARHLLIAGAEHVRRVRGQLRPRAAGCPDVCELGDRLPQVRLVRRPESVHG
jgi:hypothetical protein